MIVDIATLADNVLLQGLAYGIAVVGLTIAFRVLRYPDLTADGSFLIGATVGGAALQHGANWILAVALAVGAGAAAGVITGLLFVVVGVNRLLSGILTTMMLYSISFRVLGGRSNIGLLEVATPFTFASVLDRRGWGAALMIHPTELAICAAMVALAVSLVYALLRSDFGLLMRATGSNSPLVESLGRSSNVVIVAGLALANALIALAGIAVASRQAFVDANMGTGVVITLIASLIIGEEVLMRTPFRRISAEISGRIVAPLLGACVYFLMYLAVVRASLTTWAPVQLQPTDLRLVSALVLAIAVALRTRQGRLSEVVPL